MTKVAGSIKIFYEERMITVKMKRMWRRIYILVWSPIYDYKSSERERREIGRPSRAAVWVAWVHTQ